MKKVIVDMAIIFIGVISSKYILRGCLYLIGTFINDNARLVVLFIPFIIYGAVLFIVVPYVIKFINSKL